MRKHVKNTPTKYEFSISDGENIVYTIWFMSRRPSLRRIYRSVVDSVDDIKNATGASDVIWNGDGTITAGKFTGKMTGNTLLQVRGYKNV